MRGKSLTCRKLNSKLTVCDRQIPAGDQKNGELAGKSETCRHIGTAKPMGPITGSAFFKDYFRDCVLRSV